MDGSRGLVGGGRGVLWEVLEPYQGEVEHLVMERGRYVIHHSSEVRRRIALFGECVLIF